jgi:uncharacterized protein YndB with AHSA1/START domain
MTEKITIEAVIKANKETVWNLYTKPEHIINWNFANNDWHCPFAENDMIVGGKYLARMEAKDGSFGFDFEAIYEEVKEFDYYTFKMTDDRVVKVRFEELDNKTKIMLTFDAEDENTLEMQRQGWQAILDNFKQYAETKN